ncbi:hypothetical protein [Nisaea sp.]|uniref:hypothetical protein n=1 Tax=Nisaea sp. TaxID=2024842 RepID=UPI00329A77CF
MRTPWCRIELAMDGKSDFIIKTNPFGSKSKGGADKPPPQFDPLRLSKENRDKVADRLRAVLGGGKP